MVPLPGALVAARYLPGGGDQVGGDWYDAVPMEDGRLVIVIGDVAGHGAGAAATMIQLRDAVRFVLLDSHGPADALDRVNRFLHDTMPDAIATAAVVILDPSTGDARFAAAGHLPLLVIAAGGVELLPAPPAPALGLTPEAAYLERPVELAIGSTVVLYTDGLVERRGEPLDTGLDRLRQVAADAPAALDDLCDRLVSQLPDAGRDDVAVIAIQLSPAAPATV